MLIDTHCHLDDQHLFDRLPEVLTRGREAGVGKYLIPGVGPEGWERIATLGRDVAECFPAFGIHPMHAPLCTPAALDRLAALAADAVAIGEIGLDYLLHHVPRELQLAAFRSQLRVAVKAGLPLLLHCRRAFNDMLKVIIEEGGEAVGGVMHAFSGSPETAAEFVRLGFAISIAGPVTWRNAVRPLQVVRQVSLEHLLLETDAPDLTPEPFRGGSNEPAFLPTIAERVAELKGVSVQEVARVTTATAERIFRLH